MEAIRSIVVLLVAVTVLDAARVPIFSKQVSRQLHYLYLV